MIASPPRLGNSTTLVSDVPLKCSAKASGSGRRASPGLSNKTNSNGRVAVSSVTGGVSQRKAEKEALANRPLNIDRNMDSSCQLRRASAKVAGFALRRMEYRKPRISVSCSLCEVHIVIYI